MYSKYSLKLIASIEQEVKSLGRVLNAVQNKRVQCIPQALKNYAVENSVQTKYPE